MPNQSSGTKPKLSSLVRFVCSLLRPNPDRSQLVVQTGFPTSLANLVVKNQSRLKTTTRSKKKKLKNRNYRSSPLPLPPPRHPYSVSDDTVRSTVPLVEGIERELGSNHREVVVDDEEKRGVKLGVLLVFLLTQLIAIAIEGKKIVIGFTCLALGLIMSEIFGVKLDFVAVRLLEFREKSGISGKEGNGGLQNCLVSSGSAQADFNNEILVETRDFDLVSETKESEGSEDCLVLAKSDEADCRTEILDEIRNLDVVAAVLVANKESEVGLNSNDKNKKKKKKFFKKIFKKSKKLKNEEDKKAVESRSSLSSSSGIRVHDSRTNDMELTKDGIEEVNSIKGIDSLNALHHASSIGRDAFETIREHVVESNGSSQEC